MPHRPNLMRDDHNVIGNVCFGLFFGLIFGGVAGVWIASPHPSSTYDTALMIDLRDAATQTQSICMHTPGHPDQAELKRQCLRLAAQEVACTAKRELNELAGLPPVTEENATTDADGCAVAGNDPLGAAMQADPRTAPMALP